MITFLLIVANIAVSYKGFRDQLFFEKYKFEVDRILIYKDYKRLITSGFLHVGWGHLIFNMISLYFFSGTIETYLGIMQFLLIYFTSLVGGNLLSLFIHKSSGSYSSVGASGAICGVIFACIALFPGFGIGFFGLPFSIPGWVYGLLFVGYSVYGIHSKKENIGHEAPLGGALIGMAVALLIRPSAFADNYITILVITLPTIAFIYLVISRPQMLLIDNYFFKKNKNFYSVDHKYNTEKKNKQNEVDRILDKINNTGISSLSKKEKDLLEEYSKTSR